MSAARIDGLRPALDAVPDAPDPQPTAVRVLWNENFLYVAFDCVDDEVFHTGTLRHDADLYKEDVVEVFLDGRGDGRQFVELQVAPDGTNLDLMYVYSADVRPGADGRIDAAIIRSDRWGFREWEMDGLRTAARRTPSGWSAELAIPAAPVVRRLGLSSLEAGLSLRAHFVRYDHLYPKDGGDYVLIQQTWNPVLTGNPHNSPFQMGTLLLLPSAAPTPLPPEAKPETTP